MKTNLQIQVSHLGSSMYPLIIFNRLVQHLVDWWDTPLWVHFQRGLVVEKAPLPEMWVVLSHSLGSWLEHDRGKVEARQGGRVPRLSSWKSVMWAAFGCPRLLPQVPSAILFYPNSHGLNSLEPVANMNLSSLSCSVCILVTTMKSI